MSLSIHTRSRHAFTLVELLVVITVIAILASMVLPAVGFARELANKSKCGSNQKGIFASLLAYTEGNDGRWPSAAIKVPTGGGGGGTASPTYTGEDAAKYTAGVFEILRAANSDTVPNALFKCPSSGRLDVGPDEKVKPSQYSNSVTWGWSSTNKVSYAMDWSAPTDAGSSRPIFSDRGADNHKKKVVIICYADGHIESSKLDMTGGGDNGTSYGYGTNIESSFAENKAGMGSEDEMTDSPPSTSGGTVSAGTVSIRDNIFSSTGDFLAAGSVNSVNTPGSGSARRAFMK